MKSTITGPDGTGTVRYSWRVAAPGSAPLGPFPGHALRLAGATASAESFLLGGSDTGDVVVVFRSQPEGPGWVPQLVGVRCGDSVAWHPWPPDWLPGPVGQARAAGCLAALTAGGDLVAAGEADSGIVAGDRGGDVVVVSVDPGRPSLVEAVAASMYDPEDDSVDDMPSGPVVRAAIEASPAGEAT